MDVIAMTSSCIERRENKLKNAVKKAQKAQKESEEKVTKIKQDTIINIFSKIFLFIVKFLKKYLL